MPAYEQRVQEIKNELLELATEQKIWSHEHIFKGDKSTSAGLGFYARHLEEEGAKLKELISKQTKIKKRLKIFILRPLPRKIP
ncbi:hypothetical protein EYC80_002286 [Monilinia laxa]|uniref:Uncharacterized protein n=1 Tax=Monilinia laxa TaxID=61186 RepID=A0A5N6K3H8_MONLA|nr:hypothetical protein EYC80_002286 [Monilinia laxa]